MKISPEEAVIFLREGKVVAVPTETVYGLAADALNPSAIAKIFEIKNRPADNPLICHFRSVKQVREYVTEIPAATETLMNHFSPGPISFMLDLAEDSPLKFATCGSAQVIARIPNHVMFLEIIKGLNRPVAAPSANTSGRVSPTSAAMVENDLGEKVETIVDGGMSEVGIESTIIDARSRHEIFLLRRGTIGEKEIQKLLPQSRITSEKIPDAQIIPGTKYRHYAPATPVFMIENIDGITSSERIALLLTDEQLDSLPQMPDKNSGSQQTKIISVGSINNLDELARNFYQHFAALDHLGITKAYLLKNDFGNSSLGKALQNRIDRMVRVS